jgi:hypothetical protein
LKAIFSTFWVEREREEAAKIPQTKASDQQQQQQKNNIAHRQKQFNMKKKNIYYIVALVVCKYTERWRDETRWKIFNM